MDIVDSVVMVDVNTRRLKLVAASLAVFRLRSY